MALLAIASLASSAQAAPDVSELARRARQFMADGKFSAAADLYAQLAQALPGDPGVAMNHGMALHMSGRFRESIPRLQAASEADLQPARASFLIGTAHLALNEPDRAVQPLQEAARASPGMAEAAHALAQALTMLGRHREAANEFRRLTGLAPSNPAAWFGLGLAYSTLSQAALNELERTAPESAYMVALAAEVQMSQGKHANALHLYREALNRQPELLGARRGIAAIYRRTGHSDWADKEEAMEPRVPEAECATRRAECLYQDGKWLELADAASAGGPAAHFWASRAYDTLASQAYERLKQLPPSAEGHEFDARTFRDQGRHRESIESWRAALKIRPEDSNLQKELAVSLQLNRDYAAARPLLQRLLASRPDSVELHYAMGSLLVNVQELDDAVRHLELVTSGEPGFLPARASLGLALMRLDRTAEAVTHLEAALPSDSDGSIHFRLAQAYQRTGQAQRANQMLETYRRILHLLDERAQFEKGLGILPP